MKAIALTACSRPDYLKQMLNSLRENNLEGYTLFMNVEPVNKDVINMVNSIDFIPTNIVVNERKLGVRLNPYTLLKRTVDEGAHSIVYLEDDLLISPDAIALSNWYFSRFDKNKYLCLNLYNHDSNPEAPNDVHVGGGFSALGFAITAFQWKKHFDPAWFAHKSGWDFSFTDLIESKRAENMLPAYSRTHHIGRFGGVHYRPHMHDEMYMHNEWNKNPVSSFKLVK